MHMNDSSWLTEQKKHCIFMVRKYMQMCRRYSEEKGLNEKPMVCII